MHHYPKTKRNYTKLNQRDVSKQVCTFCTSTRDEAILAQNDSMYIVANRVAYDRFEGYAVADHLLVIPKQHRESLDEFTQEEVLDYHELASKYERLGYSIYARGFGSSTRSVAHQHTHLIKLTGKGPKILVYTARPHALIVR